MQDMGSKEYVFLSYSRDDREIAIRIAEAIERQGISVWWDTDIPAGVPYVKSIEKSLKSARSVVVLWSTNSTQSRWVRNEADWGAEREQLLPVRIDDVDIPWEFRNFQTLDLIDWSGDESDPNFLNLIQGLRAHFEQDSSSSGTDLISPDPGIADYPREHKPRTKPRAAPLAGARRHLLPSAIVVLLALMAIWFIRDQIHTRSISRIPDPLGELSYTPLTGEGKTQGSCISPDGKYLAYVLDEDGQHSLRLKQITTGHESVILPRDRHPIQTPVFSPDGQFVFLAMKLASSHRSEYDLYRVSMLGGTPQRVVTNAIGRRIDCSPDGSRLVFKRTVGDSLHIITAAVDGSDERLLATQTRDITVPCCLAWSSDGDEIYSTARDSITGFLSISAYSAIEGSCREVAGGDWQAILDLSRLGSKEELLVVGLPSGDEYELNLNLWILRKGAEKPKNLTNDITNYRQASSDTAGNQIALSYYAFKRVLRVVPLESPELYEDISTDIVSNSRVIWSSPGILLANQRVGSRVGLVYLDLVERIARQVVTDVDYIVGMALSPDRTRLVYTSFAGIEFKLWIAESDGGSPRLLTGGGGIERYPLFTPDGASVIYANQEAVDRPFFLKRIDIDDGSIEQISDIPGRIPCISPDGRQLVALFQDQETGNERPATIPVEGGTPQFLSLPANFTILGWNPQGDGFLGPLHDGPVPQVWNVPLKGGEPTQLTDFPPNHRSIVDLNWNSAGDSMALTLEIVTFDAMLVRGTNQ